ncbi:MAG: hypothetical protein IPO44_06665 [Candidatus Microthrix sp.]|nr:hypothetical protein [Candidatus Microthrix sp.]MBK9559233.1 hypothetical protein [Candidatus Microthrix sp.]
MTTSPSASATAAVLWLRGHHRAPPPLAVGVPLEVHPVGAQPGGQLDAVLVEARPLRVVQVGDGGDLVVFTSRLPGIEDDLCGGLVECAAGEHVGDQHIGRHPATSPALRVGGAGLETDAAPGGGEAGAADRIGDRRLGGAQRQRTGGHPGDGGAGRPLEQVTQLVERGAPHRRGRMRRQLFEDGDERAQRRLRAGCHGTHRTGAGPGRSGWTIRTRR